MYTRQPLKDPIKYKVLGYEISLRRQEAEMIEVVSEEEAKKQAEKAVYHEGHRRRAARTISLSRSEHSYVSLCAFPS